MECWNPAGCRIFGNSVAAGVYNANLRYTKERTVVTISDAMRYEVGQELFARMQDNPKCTAKLSVQLSVLPSYTRLGMAALLPHKTLE